MKPGVRIFYTGPRDALSTDVLVRVAERHAQRDLVLSFDQPPIPFRGADWSATDWNTYDGAPDSGNRHQVGRGPTAEAALCNLLDILEDDEADEADPQNYSLENMKTDPQAVLSWTERDIEGRA